MHFARSIVLGYPIPFLKLNGDHFGVNVKRNGDHFGVGIISGSIWVSFQGWGSFRGLYSSKYEMTKNTYGNRIS